MAKEIKTGQFAISDNRVLFSSNIDDDIVLVVNDVTAEKVFMSRQIHVEDLDQNLTKFLWNQDHVYHIKLIGGRNIPQLNDVKLAADELKERFNIATNVGYANNLLQKLMAIINVKLKSSVIEEIICKGAKERCIVNDKGTFYINADATFNKPHYNSIFINPKVGVIQELSPDLERRIQSSKYSKVSSTVSTRNGWSL